MSFLTTGNRSESGYSLNPAMYEALSISEPNLNSRVVKAVRIGYYSHWLEHPRFQIWPHSRFPGVSNGLMCLFAYPHKSLEIKRHI